jgi:hypothetical protein
MDPEGEIAKHEADLAAWRAKAAAEVDELVAAELARLEGEARNRLAAAVAAEQRLDRQHRLRLTSVAAQRSPELKAEAERRASDVGVQLDAQRQTVAQLDAGLADALALAQEQATAAGVERAASLVEPPALVERLAELYAEFAEPPDGDGDGGLGDDQA